MDAVLQEGEEGQALQGALYARLPPRWTGNARNLRYACYQCNAKKGASLNVIWRFRASVGMSGTYWALKRVIRTGFSVAVILFTIYISIPCAR